MSTKECCTGWDHRELRRFHLPCEACGTKLLLTQPSIKKTMCPKCYGCITVDRDLAITISTTRLLDIYILFLQYLRQFKKTRLIAHLGWEREKYSRKVFDNYPEPIDLSMFVSFSYLIRLLMIEEFDGNIEANEANTPALVETFSKYLGLLTEHIYLREGFAEMVATETFDFSTLTVADRQRLFLLIYNEDYVPLLRTFANNQIYTEKEGKKKGEEYRPLWETFKRQIATEKKVAYTAREMIRTNYTILNALYCGLLKNVFYARTFDFSNYQGVVHDPAQIMEVANSFALVEGVATVTPLHEFRAALKRYFGSHAWAAEPLLLFSRRNTATFPLFILLDGQVFISHRTAFLIYAFLHPILMKEYYDKETAQLTKQLESGKAREEFERAGFRYVPNVLDRPKNPHMEIDALAGRNGVLLVVEVKGWGLTPFYEHKNKHEYLERDLKGIVDGIKYTTKNGKLTQKKATSLFEKIEYATKNMQKHGFDPVEFKAIYGIIVIEDFPPINEYKGVRIVGLEDVSKLQV